MKDLLDLADLGPDGFRRVIDLARRPIDALGEPLKGRGVALVFEKPSNRTRQSMEVAVVQLGGHPVYTRGEEIGFDVREPVEDIGRIMSGYHAVVGARVFSHDVVRRLAASCSVPVVNMLSDLSHPLQGLADALTMLDEFGDLGGRTVAWIGDYNNVARSLGQAVAYSGGAIAFGCPDGFAPTDDELRSFRALGATAATSDPDPRRVVAGACAVHTDTWVSMGQEDEKEARRRIFRDYSVDEELMANAAPDAIFMHCLPAYRGLEVAPEVIDGPRSRVVQQGHNRLHTARAVIAHLMGVR